MAQRIVIIGGGYAGLAAVGELQNNPHTEITLIDPGQGHELIPEMPEALRRHDTIEEHVVPYQILLEDSNVQHIQDFVTKVNVQEKTVTTDGGNAISYDWLVIAPGSVPFFPPIPGLKDKAQPLRNADDTRKIKESLQYAKHQRVVVVGGGLTGVEVAGILAPEHDVLLIEGATTLLPALGQGLAQYAYRRLQSAGVQIILGQKLVTVEDDSVQLEKDRFHYDVLIWAGGIAPPYWLTQTDLPLDKRGYPITDAYGEVLPGVFAAGDMWRVTVNGEDVPQTAQVAALAGTFIGQTISARLACRGPEFRPQLRGMLISLDPGQGVGWVLTGGIPVRGYSARTLKNISFKQYRQKLAKTFKHKS